MIIRKAAILIIVLTCFLACKEEEKKPIDSVLSVFSISDIVYNSEKSGSYQIYSKNLVTGIEVQLTNNTDYDYWWPRISPDRTRVLYYRAPSC